MQSYHIIISIWQNGQDDTIQIDPLALADLLLRKWSSTIIEMSKKTKTDSYFFLWKVTKFQKTTLCKFCITWDILKLALNLHLSLFIIICSFDKTFTFLTACFMKKSQKRFMLCTKITIPSYIFTTLDKADRHKKKKIALLVMNNAFGTLKL